MPCTSGSRRSRRRAPPPPPPPARQRGVAVPEDRLGEGAVGVQIGRENQDLARRQVWEGFEGVQEFVAQYFHLAAGTVAAMHTHREIRPGPRCRVSAARPARRTDIRLHLGQQCVRRPPGAFDDLLLPAFGNERLLEAPKALYGLPPKVGEKGMPLPGGVPLLSRPHLIQVLGRRHHGAYADPRSRCQRTQQREEGGGERSGGEYLERGRQLAVAGMKPSYEVAETSGRMRVVGETPGETPPEFPLPGLVLAGGVGEGLPRFAPVPGGDHLGSEVEVLVEAVRHFGSQSLPRPGIPARLPEALGLVLLDHACQEREDPPRETLRAPGGMDRVQADEPGCVFDEGAREEEDDAHRHSVAPGQSGLGALHQGHRRHQHGHHHPGAAPRPAQRVDQVVDQQGRVRGVFQVQRHGRVELGGVVPSASRMPYPARRSRAPGWSSPVGQSDRGVKIDAAWLGEPPGASGLQCAGLDVAPCCRRPSGQTCAAI